MIEGGEGGPYTDMEPVTNFTQVGVVIKTFILKKWKAMLIKQSILKFSLKMKNNLPSP